jgi:hypothetical protein
VAAVANATEIDAGLSSLASISSILSIRVRSFGLLLMVTASGRDLMQSSGVPHAPQESEAREGGRALLLGRAGRPSRHPADHQVPDGEANNQ